MADESIPQKSCIRCGLAQAETEFYFQKYICKDGSRRRAGACRACVRKATNAADWKKINRARSNENSRQWYHKNKPKAREAGRKTRARNRPYYRQKAREYQAADPERYRLYGITATATRKKRGFYRGLPEIRKAIKDTLESYRIGDQYWDVYESRLIDKATIDHIVPLSKDGGNEMENLTVTSLANNSQKHNTPLLVWLAKRAARTRAQAPDGVIPDTQIPV